MEFEANFSFVQEPMVAVFELTPQELDKFFVFEQAMASDVWVIRHNLRKKPSITVVDSADTVVQGSYTYNDLNTVTLKFNYPFTGKAYLN